MALVKCPECQGNISDKARTCPHCGYPLTPEISRENVLNPTSLPTESAVRVLEICNSATSFCIGAVEVFARITQIAISTGAFYRQKEKFYVRLFTLADGFIDECSQRTAVLIREKSLIDEAKAMTIQALATECRTEAFSNLDIVLRQYGQLLKELRLETESLSETGAMLLGSIAGRLAGGNNFTSGIGALVGAASVSAQKKELSRIAQKAPIAFLNSYLQEMSKSLAVLLDFLCSKSVGASANVYGITELQKQIRARAEEILSDLSIKLLELENTPIDSAKILCPKCGKENRPMNLHCVHCYNQFPVL